jgi:hypothetical protein
MNASKEEAYEALGGFLKIIESSPSLQSTFNSEIQQISQFLKAAGKKLPSEQAYENDKARREKRKT